MCRVPCAARVVCCVPCVVWRAGMRPSQRAPLRPRRLVCVCLPLPRRRSVTQVARLQVALPARAMTTPQQRPATRLTPLFAGAAEAERMDSTTVAQTPRYGGDLASAAGKGKVSGFRESGWMPTQPHGIMARQKGNQPSPLCPVAVWQGLTPWRVVWQRWLGLRAPSTSPPRPLSSTHQAVHWRELRPLRSCAVQKEAQAALLST